MIPATYKVIRVQEIDTEATNKAAKEETYQTVQSTYMSKQEELKWERILCETNMNKGTVKELQQVLADRNYNPGGIDDGYGRNRRHMGNNKKRKNNRRNNRNEQKPLHCG